MVASGQGLQDLSDVRGTVEVNGQQLIAVVLGYLVGSVSFARIVARIRIPNVDITTTEYPVEGTAETWVYTGVSATSLSSRAGAWWAVAVVALDATKALVPTLMAKLTWPDDPIYLMVALAVIIGHIWPVWHQFKGGRGQSCILGALLVIDPLSILFGAAVGAVVGVTIFTSAYLARNGSPFFFPPWFLIVDGLGPSFAFSIVLGFVYFLAIRTDISEERRVRRSTGLESIAWSRRVRRSFTDFVRGD